MKRKSAQTNPETPLEAVSEEAAVAVEAESTSTIAETNEASVQAEVTEQSAMQLAAEPPAVETVESEAAEATAAPSAAEVLPALGKHLGKAVYGIFYYASYGVVFTALMTARIVPMNNLIGRAIKEGALAAESAAKALDKPAVSQETAPDDSFVLNASNPSSVTPAVVRAGVCK